MKKLFFYELATGFSRACALKYNGLQLVRLIKECLCVYVLDYS